MSLRAMGAQYAQRLSAEPVAKMKAKPLGGHLPPAQAPAPFIHTLMQTNAVGAAVGQVSAAGEAGVAAAQAGQGIGTPAYGAADIRAIAAGLAFWIPAETIVLYGAVISLLGTSPWASPKGCSLTFNSGFTASIDFYSWCVIVFFTVLSPVIVYVTARENATAAKLPFVKPSFEIFASMVAFLAWANYLPNSIIAHCFGLPFFATVVPMVLVQLALYVTGHALGLNPPAPFVTAGAAGAAGPNAASPLDGPTIPPVEVNASNPAIVIANSVIQPIFMGAAWSEQPDLQAKLISVLNAFIVSQTFKDMSVYGVISATLLQAQPMSLPAATANSICADTDVTPLLSQIADRLGRPGGLVMLVFNPPGVDVTYQLGTMRTCRDECGFHQTFMSSDGNTEIPYGVVAYADKNCPGCSTTRSFPASIMSSAIHELAEMLTNPNPILANGYITQEANWREIADDCQGANSTTYRTPYGDVALQQIYIKGQNNVPGCCS